MNRRRITNVTIVIFLVMSILLISIGFASLNTQMSISGDAYITMNNDILINSVKMKETINEGYETYNVVFSNNQATMFVTLPNEESKISYTIEIINYSSDKYILKTIDTSNTNENIKYKFDKLEPKDVFLGGRKTEITITFYYDSEVLPETSTTFMMNLAFEAYNDNEPNEPVLASNMIPVYYDENSSAWQKANASNTDINYGWYNYRKKIWANAVTVNEDKRSEYLSANVGTAIDMNDINTMWVWIPRFSAVTPSNYNGGTSQNPGEIIVNFAPTSVNALDAFTFGNQNLSGAWISKFENSATESPDVADNLEKVVLNKPGLTAWTNANVSTFFNSILKMKETGNIYGFDINVNPTLDTHMLKNNEWGAVAYLTNSKYGRCDDGICQEVRLNNCRNRLTGVSASNDNDYQAYAVCTSADNQYDQPIGVLASTTGNIYGIYDMSGGINEYVMGIYDSNLGSTGFTTLPDSKYYNAYLSLYTGHALKETQRWYEDYSEKFVSADVTLAIFTRGGYYADFKSAGLFYWMSTTGEAHLYRGVRNSLTIR